MDYHKPLALLHMAEEASWVNKINMARVDGRLCNWATGFHPQKLSCQLAGGFINGSYNLGQSLAFEDRTIWFLRLPRVGSNCPGICERESGPGSGSPSSCPRKDIDSRPEEDLRLGPCQGKPTRSRPLYLYGVDRWCIS